MNPNLIDIITRQSCTTKEYILNLSSLIRNDSYKMEIYLLTVNRTLLFLVAERLGAPPRNAVMLIDLLAGAQRKHCPILLD